MGMKSNPPAPGSPLGKRQHQVLVYVCKGFTDPQIAGLMGVKLSTIEDHLRRLLIKLEVSTRAEAAYRAGKMGVVA